MPSSSKIAVFYQSFREISNVGEILELVAWKVTEALNAKGALLRILNLQTKEFELST